MEETKPYSRSYDLIAHMVNAQGKYPAAATSSTNYSADGSDGRDATAEEKTRYLNANQHKRKKAVDAPSSDEQSRSTTGPVLSTSGKDVCFE